MATVIDEAIIALKLDDHVTAEMAAAVAKAKAEAEELGHIRAKIKVDADTAKARAELDALKAKLGDLDKMDEGQAAAGKARLNELEKELKKRQEVGRVMGLISRQAQRDIAAETVAEKTRGRTIDETIKKRENAAKSVEKLAKAQSDAYKMDEARTRSLAKLQDDAAKEDARRTAQKESDVRNLAKAQSDAAKEDARRTTQQEADTRSLARMQDQASAEDARRAKVAEGQGLRDAQAASRRLRLQQQEITQRERVNELTKAFSRAQGSDKIRVSVDTLSAVKQLEETRAAMALLGAKPIDIKTRVESGGVLGKLKTMAGGTSSFAGDSRVIRNVGSEIGSLGSKLDKARVNLFGVSLTLKSLLVGASALSPVLLGLVGAAGSLISVVGAGLGGAAGVGAAALTGFGMAFVGILSNVKPFITGLTQAHKYTTTLNTALAKYGATSKQGKAAQAAFNHEMKSLPPTVAQTVQGFESLKQKWQGLTKGVADHNIANIVGSTFKTVRADMGFFAKDTNTSFTALSKGWSNIMSDFRSGSGRGALSNIFGKSAASVAPLMGAFRALAHAGALVTSSFANFLPGLSKGFQQWAFNISDAADKSHGFASGARSMVDAMRSVGHFAESAGKMLVTFFKAGVGPGAGLLDTMTGSFNRLNDSMKTVSGQQKLQNFFARSVQTTKELWNALLPLGSAFVQFAQATAPVANIMLRIVSAFTKLVAFAVGFKPFQIILGGGAALALLLKMTATLREASMLAFRVGKGIATFGTSMLFGGGVKGSWRNAFPKATSDAAASEAAAALGESAAGLDGAAAALSESAAMLSGAAGAEGAASAERAAASTVGAGEQLAIPGLEAGAGVGLGAEAAVIAPEAAVATEGVTGLGAALAAMTGPVGLAVLGIGGLAVALSLMSSDTDQAKRAEKDLADTRRIASQVSGINRSVSALPGIRQTGSAAVTALPGDQKSVNSLQTEYNRLVETGAKDSAHARQVLQQLNGAISQQQQDQTSANDSIRKAHGLHVQQATDLQDKVKTALGKTTDAQDAYNKANGRYQEDLKHMPRDINVFKNDEEQRNKTLKALTQTQQTYNRVTSEASSVQAKLITDNINSKRVQAGMPLVLNTQAVAVGNLGKQIGLLGGKNANKAFNFVVHTPNPADLVKISNLINGLNPKDKKAAITVLANTKDAAQALRELDRIKIKDQTMKVSADLGNTVAQIAKVEGIKLTPKMQRLLSTGGPQVIAEVAHVMGIRLPPKVLRLLGNAQDAIAKHNQVAGLRDVSKALSILGNNGSAMSAIGAVISGLAGIQSKTVTMTVVGVLAGNPKALSKLGFAGGGMAMGTLGLGEGRTALENRQAQAAVEAGRRAPQQTRGGMYNKPTYLVGEENRGEYVIATNPSYRRENLRYLAMAASSLGAHVVAAARGFGPTSGVTDVTTPGALTTKTVGKGKKRHKVTVPGKPHHDRAFDGVPPADMIGGVGTGDIDNQVSNTQQRVNTDKSFLHSLKARKRHDSTQIGKYNHRGRKLTSAEVQAKKQAQDDLAALNAKKGPSSISAHQSTLDKENHDLGIYKAIQHSAATYMQKFTTIENSASAVQALRDAAGANPKDTSQGWDPTAGKNGAYVTHTWNEWNQVLSGLDHSHTALLKQAFDDLRGRIGSKSFPPTAKNLGFVSTLEAALGASIGTAEGVDTDRDPNAPSVPSDVPGKQKTIGGVTFTYPEALADYLDLSGLTDTLNWDEVAVTQAGIAAQKNPGDPSTSAGVQAAAQQLADFYKSVYSGVQTWPNPVTGGLDPGLINEAGQAYLGALQGVTQVTPSGPTQGQLAATALAGLGSTYGSNTGLIPGLGLDGGGMANALGGGGAASAALGDQVASRVTRSLPTAPAGQVAPQQAGHTVINNYKHMPEDPHAWSKGILWELNA